MYVGDLRRLAASGEGRHLEFKRRISSPERLAREIVAFANTRGGTILLGVEDDGTLVGLKDIHEELHDIERALRDHISPPVDLEVQTVSISRKREVIVLHVAAGTNKPHFVQQSGSTEPVALVRVSHQTVVASDEMVKLLSVEGAKDGVNFEFGDKEKFLLHYLEEFDSITRSEYARLAGLTDEQASQTLVILARADILSIEPGERVDRFRINPRAVGNR